MVEVRADIGGAWLMIPDAWTAFTFRGELYIWVDGRFQWLQR